MSLIDRIPTGIPGLDKLIEEGLPQGNTVLLSGSCGTGKSIFALQFCYAGAKQYNEPSVFITLEQRPDEVVKVMQSFGWDVDKLVKDKKLLVLKPKDEDPKVLKEAIYSAVKETKAKRLVIDSVSLLSMYFKNDWELREGLKDLHWHIKDLGCTTLLISDIKERSALYSPSGFEEFIVDGVIVLRIISKEAGGGHTRALFIRKMRGTEHSLDVFPMKIGKKGIEVFPNLRIFEQEYGRQG